MILPDGTTIDYERAKRPDIWVLVTQGQKGRRVYQHAYGPYWTKNEARKIRDKWKKEMIERGENPDGVRWSIHHVINIDAINLESSRTRLGDAHPNSGQRASQPH